MKFFGISNTINKLIFKIFSSTQQKLCRFIIINDINKRIKLSEIILTFFLLFIFLFCLAFFLKFFSSKFFYVKNIFEPRSLFICIRFFVIVFFIQ